MQANIEYLRKKKPMTTLFDLRPCQKYHWDLWQIAAYNPFQGATVANMSPRLADDGWNFPIRGDTFDFTATIYGSEIGVAPL